MSKSFIELTRDNLSSFITAPKLIVIFGIRSCRACNELKPKWKEVSDLVPMVYVDVNICQRSIKLYPKVLKAYPTMTYYENGYYKGDLNFDKMWFDIEKIYRNEFI